MSLKFTRAAALLELDGEVFLLNLSRNAWHEVLAIAAKEGDGKLPVSRVPNQAVLDAINECPV